MHIKFKIVCKKESNLLIIVDLSNIYVNIIDIIELKRKRKKIGMHPIFAKIKKIKNLYIFSYLICLNCSIFKHILFNHNKFKSETEITTFYYYYNILIKIIIINFYY